MLRFTRRDLISCGVALTAADSVGGASRHEPSPPVSNPHVAEPLKLVDPELRGFLHQLPRERLVYSTQTIQKLRSNTDYAEQTAQQLSLPKIAARTISSSTGARHVPVFVVNGSPGDQPRPGLLFIHGGGFIGGSTAGSFPGFSGLQRLARDHHCTVVSVDYRLAPEMRYPGSLEDNYEALKWLYANAAALGVDAQRIAVMGESAGGGHAAMLTLAARDRGEIPLLFQLLIYPMLDDRTGSTITVPPHIGTFIWTREANRFAWTAFLGVRAGSAVVPQGSVPARVHDLRGLPPTYIGVGSLDLFVNEDIEFARRLLDAGVPTELNVAPGAYHGFFFLVPDAAVSRRFSDSFNAALAKAFAV